MSLLQNPSKMSPILPRNPDQIIAPFEVVTHNKPNDCWISFLGKVFDVTSIIRDNGSKQCVGPLVAFAGKDVSHWFDETTGEILQYINPITGVEVPFCPHGPIPDIPPAYDVPSTLWKPIEGVPWWKNKRYQIGLLTKRVRPLKIINMLICKEIVLNVCCEDTFMRIMDRYSHFNSDGDSYVWRYLDRNVDMEKTMEENGIPDERDYFVELGIPQSYYTPAVFLYYKDDMKYYEAESEDEEYFDGEI